MIQEIAKCYATYHEKVMQREQIEMRKQGLTIAFQKRACYVRARFKEMSENSERKLQEAD